MKSKTKTNIKCENIIKNALSCSAIVDDGDGLITCIVVFWYKPLMNYAIANMDDYKHLFEERGYTVTSFYPINDGEVKYGIGFELQEV